SFHRVFDNFLDLIVYAVSQQEEKYMEVIERIKDDRQEGERNIDYYTQAFSQLVEGMENNQLEDLLGDIFENRVSLGQNG
ncbi:MAG: SAM-dependent DNA methyltransferase, partial [Candidatus Woesearchaeota archaeon]